MEDNRNNSNRDLWIAGAAGLIGGAIAGYWLNSRQGRKWRSDTADKLVETRDNVQSAVSDQLDNLRSQGESLMVRGQEWLSKTEEATRTGQSAVEKGTEKAKAKLDEITS